MSNRWTEIQRGQSQERVRVIVSLYISLNPNNVVDCAEVSTTQNVHKRQTGCLNHRQSLHRYECLANSYQQRTQLEGCLLWNATTRQKRHVIPCMARQWRLVLPQTSRTFKTSPYLNLWNAQTLPNKRGILVSSILMIPLPWSLLRGPPICRTPNILTSPKFGTSNKFKYYKHVEMYRKSLRRLPRCNMMKYACISNLHVHARAIGTHFTCIFTLCIEHITYIYIYKYNIIIIIIIIIITSSSSLQPMNWFLLIFLCQTSSLQNKKPVESKGKGTRSLPQGLRNLNRQCSSSPAFTYGVTGLHLWGHRPSPMGSPAFTYGVTGLHLWDIGRSSCLPVKVYLYHLLLRWRCPWSGRQKIPEYKRQLAIGSVLPPIFSRFDVSKVCRIFRNQQRETHLAPLHMVGESHFFFRVCLWIISTCHTLISIDVVLGMNRTKGSD